MAVEVDQKWFLIDKDHLDIEWESQSVYAYELNRIAAQARLKLEDTKRELEVQRAATYNAVRRNPEAYGLAKPTESSIAAVVTTNYEVQELNKEVVKARQELDIANAAVNAIENKKAALDGLTKLKSMNYFSAK